MNIFLVRVSRGVHGEDLTKIRVTGFACIAVIVGGLVQVLFILPHTPITISNHGTEDTRGRVGRTMLPELI